MLPAINAPGMEQAIAEWFAAGCPKPEPTPEPEHTTVDMTVTNEGGWFRIHIDRVYPTNFDGRGLS